MPVTLSAAKGLARRTHRSCAALRMTGRTLLTFSHGKSSRQTSGSLCERFKSLSVKNQTRANFQLFRFFVHYGQNGRLTSYCPPKITRGLSVGMALAGGVMVSGSLNLLRSTIESRVVVIFDGTVAVVVAAGVPDAPLKELRSALRLNFNSVRWT